MRCGHVWFGVAASTLIIKKRELIKNREVESVQKTLADAGFRVETDLRNEKVGKKIAEAETQKVPYTLVTGDRDAAAGTVSVRQRGGTDLGALSVDEFLQRLREETTAKSG